MPSDVLYLCVHHAVAHNQYLMITSLLYSICTIYLSDYPSVQDVFINYIRLLSFISFQDIPVSEPFPPIEELSCIDFLPAFAQFHCLMILSYHLSYHLSYRTNWKYSLDWFLTMNKKKLGMYPHITSIFYITWFLFDSIELSYHL